MFRCRLSLALGIPPSNVDLLPARDVDLLQRYWRDEPWGSFRDNLHAAMIAREIRINTQARYPDSRAPSRIPVLDDFMVATPERRAAQFDRRGFFDAFRAMAMNGVKHD